MTRGRHEEENERATRERGLQGDKRKRKEKRQEKENERETRERE
jgi:hypothetical protein